MSFTCAIYTLSFFKSINLKIRKEKTCLIIFIICFPLNIILGILISCVRKIARYLVVQIIFFIIGTLSFTYIYFYLSLFIDNRIVISFILLQICGAIGRLVYGIKSTKYYSYIDFVLYSVLFIVIFEPIILLYWTDNLLIIGLLFLIICIYSIYLHYDLFYTLNELDTKYHANDYFICSLIHYLGLFYFISRGCAQTKSVK